MELMSNIAIAWQWLKVATAAKKALVTDDQTFTTGFYENKIHTMQFYFKYELPKISSAQTTLMHEESLTIPEVKEGVFK